MNGELWTPGGRLTDYSYAGYMGNDAPIPSNPVTDSVKNYGAVGNGIVDDSGAFLAAIARLRPGGVLYVPAGALFLQQVVIRKSPLTGFRSPSGEAFLLSDVGRLKKIGFVGRAIIKFSLMESADLGMDIKYG